jgi:hypothetical protein
MNPRNLHPAQKEFEFVLTDSLRAPTLENRVLCCTLIPEQHDHPQFHARCFGDEPRCRRPTPALPQGRASGFPAPQSAELDQRSAGT